MSYTFDNENCYCLFFFFGSFITLFNSQQLVLLFVDF